MKKIEAFNEISTLKNQKDFTKQKPDLEPLKQEVIELKQELLRCVNEVRLNNVISKFGEVRSTDRANLINLLTTDAMEEVLKHHKPKHDILDKKDQRMIAKMGSTASGKVVDAYLKKNNITCII